EDLPVYGTIAARFNDDGVTALYQHLKDVLAAHGLRATEGTLAPVEHKTSTKVAAIVPPARSRYLAEIAESVRSYHATTEEQADAVRTVQHLRTARDVLTGRAAPGFSGDLPREERGGSPENGQGVAVDRVDEAISAAERQVAPESRATLDAWPTT